MFKKLFKNEFIRLMSFMGRDIWLYYTGILGDSIIGACFNSLQAFVIKDIVDAAIKRDMGLMYRAIILVTIGTLTIASSTVFLRYMHTSRVKRVMAKLRLLLFSHVESLPAGYFEKNHSGDVISKMTNDLNQVESAYSYNLHMSIFSVIDGTIAALSIFILDWRIAVLLIIFGLLTFVINTRFYKPLRKLSDLLQKRLGKLTECFVDIMAGFSVMKVFSLGKIITGQYKVLNEDIVDATMKRARINAALESTNFLLNCLNVMAIMSLGVWMYMNRMLEFGTIIAMTSLVGRVNSMFLRASRMFSQLQSSLAGAGRVLSLLDETPEPDKYDSGSDTVVDKMIDLRDVYFNYDDGKSVLDGLNISVSKGHIAALAGTSGGGKSTVIKLLMGFYKACGGNISINSKSLSSYSLLQLRDMMAYVPQDASIFDGTIMENIRFGKYDADEKKVVAAAKAANIHDFIVSQPLGYKTLVGERGVRLSGGQKQRIAIARAVLKDAPILLLDEATSSLDSENEKLVQEALNRLMKGRTSIVIAHRLSTIEHADVIYVIDNGKVAEKGTHEDLLKAGGIYNRLYNLQFNDDTIENAG